MFDRRPFYSVGAAVGLVIVAFFLFGPKMTPEQRVAKDLAVMAREPWHPIYVKKTEVLGQREAFVYGQRPDGTEVVVHFVTASPYTASTAVRRLAEHTPRNQDTEILMIPRSMVRKEFRELFHPDATHAGIALFAGIPTVDGTEHDAAVDPGDMSMESESPSGS